MCVCVRACVRMSARTHTVAFEAVDRQRTSVCIHVCMPVSLVQPRARLRVRGTDQRKVTAPKLAVAKEAG